MDLVDAEAVLTVIAPEVSPAVAAAARAGRLRYLARRYRHGDLAGAFVAYAAVGDDAVHREIAAEARAAGVLLNVVDRPEWCDFTTPAIVRRGRVGFAISTGGASPALAGKLRRELEERYGPEYAAVAELLWRMRQRPEFRRLGFADKRTLFGRLVDGPLVEYVREGRIDRVDALLAEAGDGLSWAALGMDEIGGER